MLRFLLLSHLAGLCAGVALGKPFDKARLTPCGCKDQSLCKPLDAPRPEKVLHIIHGSSSGSEDNPRKYYGESFRWDLATSVAWAVGHNESICYAHARGVRVFDAVSMSVLPTGTPHERFCPAGGPDCPGNPDQAEFTAMLTNASARSEFVAAQFRYTFRPPLIVGCIEPRVSKPAPPSP